MARYEDVRRSGINPFVHYLSFGRKEGRIAERSDRAESVQGKGGRKERTIQGAGDLHLLPSVSLAQQRLFMLENGFFDEAYYRHVYPDVLKGKIDPFEHYVHQGAREGRNPSSTFDTRYYRSMNLDLGAKENPLIHYAMHGGPLSGRVTHPRLIGGYALDQDPRSGERRLSVRTDGAPDLVAPPNLRVAVHIHCYYFDQFPEIIERLSALPMPFELFISVGSVETAAQCKKLADEHGWTATIDVVPNRGRDLGPLLVQYRKSMSAFDLVLHVHTKKSKERDGDFGVKWGRDLLDKLLFNREYVIRILHAFAEDKRMGILAPTPYQQIRPFMVWGLNRDISKDLMESAVGDASMIGADCPPFPAGAMFWFRPQALQPLFDLELEYTDFPEEPISDDGTIAHAIERCLFVVPQHGGWRTGYVEMLPQEKCWPAVIPPTVTVIVPVFNGGQWLIPALQSVVGQDSPGCKIELIVVDNGSTDGSLDELRTFELLHRPGVRLLHAKRKGAGSARNVGLDAATGEFVMFLDADDLLTTNAVALLHAAMRRSEADVVTSSLVMFDEEKLLSPLPFPTDSKVPVLEPSAFGESLNEWRRIFSDFGPCAKLYRRSFLDKNKIRFPEGRNFEDNLFIADVYMKLTKMAVVHSPTYMYRRYHMNKGSTQSTTLDLAALSDQVWVAKEIIREHGLDSKSR
ncbi:MAG TPA: rhamnan synthesis F family protein, partial [Devosia sp.]|nr:rhamnan synthesis F family protein [Devosia sp.]